MIVLVTAGGDDVAVNIGAIGGALAVVGVGGDIDTVEIHIEISAVAAGQGDGGEDGGGRQVGEVEEDVPGGRPVDAIGLGVVDEVGRRLGGDADAALGVIPVIGFDALADGEV